MEIFTPKMRDKEGISPSIEEEEEEEFKFEKPQTSGLHVGERKKKHFFFSLPPLSFLISLCLSQLRLWGAPMLPPFGPLFTPTSPLPLPASLHLPRVTPLSTSPFSFSSMKVAKQQSLIAATLTATSGDFDGHIRLWRSFRRH